MRDIAAAALALGLVLALPGHTQSAPETELETPTDAAGAPGENSLAIGAIAAIVNDSPISYDDVAERAQLLLMSLGSQPTEEQFRQIQGQALEQLIDERLQLQEATEYEVEVGTDAINAEIQDLARQSGLEGTQMVEQLRASGIDPASLEDQVRAEIAWRRIMQGLYGSRIRISDNQVDEQLDRLRRSAQVTQYRVSEIFLYAPDEASRQQAMDAAQSIIQQIEGGAPFQLAAQRFSSAPTAATGGDMGWMSLDDLDPELAEAVDNLGEPGLTDPIPVEDGIYILAVRNRRAPQEASNTVSLTRLVADEGNRDALQSALDQIETCADIDPVAGDQDAVRSTSQTEVDLTTLNEETRARIAAAQTGGPTEIFDSAAGPAVLFVCERATGLPNLPSPDQIENSLFGQQLSLISQRALRDLRREATIIRR